MHMRYRICALALAFVAGCFPNPPKRDAGDSAFVRQVVPQLLGRQPVNREEVRFFNDVIDGLATPDEGRRGLIRGLMRSEEFASRWNEQLLRHANVNREQDGQLAACYETPNLATSAGLVNSLTGTPMGNNVPVPDFNGADLLASTFAQPDADLSAFLRMNLMATHAARVPGDSERTVTDRVQSVYLDRDFECLGCHNSNYATTGEGSGWKRHYPMLGHFEESLYGDHSGPASLLDVTRVFRFAASQNPHDCMGASPCTDNEQPWGHLSKTCGDFVQPASIPSSGRDLQFGTVTFPEGNVWDVENMFRSGIENMRDDWLQRTTGPEDALCANCPAGAFQQMVQDNCMGCHSSSGSASSVFYFQLGATANDLAVVDGGSPMLVSNDAAFRATLLSRVMSDSMPPTMLSSEDRDYIKDTVTEYFDDLDDGITCECSGDTVPRKVNPLDAFAFLAAANLVNGTWQELYGRPLTVPNHFPRTSAQSAALEFLAQRVVHDGWSLRALLERLYLGRYFNREAPEKRTPGIALTSHFEVPAALDPWTQADRRVDPSPDAIGSKNAMTEGIRRRPVRTLFQMAHKALGWPAPKLFPDNDTPSADLHASLGDELSTLRAGNVDTNIQNLLVWESYAGTCTSPGGGSDWIDSLMSEGVSHGMTREQAVIALKDRLIAEPWIGNTEERNMLELALSGLASPLTAADESNFRGLCGALLHSPQYMLQGLAPNGERTPETVPLVCGDEDTCSYGAFCQRWKPAFQAAGYTLSCPLTPLRRLDIDLRLRADVELIPRLCVDGVCGIVPERVSRRCYKDGQSCLPKGVAACDTRCTGLFCCGAPLQDIDEAFSKAQTPPLLYTVADSSKVRRAVGVLIVRKGETRRLRDGDLLIAGDILRFTQGSQLISKGRYGSIKTPEKGFYFKGEFETVDVLIGQIDKLDIDPDEYWGSRHLMQSRQRGVLKRLYRDRTRAALEAPAVTDHLTPRREEDEQKKPRERPKLPVVPIKRPILRPPGLVKPILLRP